MHLDANKLWITFEAWAGQYIPFHIKGSQYAMYAQSKKYIVVALTPVFLLYLWYIDGT